MENVKRYKGRKRVKRQEIDKGRTRRKIDIGLSDGGRGSFSYECDLEGRWHQAYQVSSGI